LSLLNSTWPPSCWPGENRRDLPEPLSEREMEVLALIAAGNSNAEIASKLFVLVSTVKTHLNNLYSKLGTRNRTQAVARAREMSPVYSDAKTMADLIGGATATVASAFVMVVAVSDTAGRLVWPILSDKIGGANVFLAMFLAQAVALLMSRCSEPDFLRCFASSPRLWHLVTGAATRRCPR
jgi:DNA-binding CsgD family transcriptional regulator